MEYLEYDSLLKVLRSFGEINLDYFIERLRLQKLGYLIQELGIDEGYSYSWYIYGPYSSTLTSALFAADDEGIFDEDVELDKKEKNVVMQLNELLGKNVNNPDALELYASIWYLMPKRTLTDDDKIRILDLLSSKKPRFSQNDIKTAINKIIEFKKRYLI